jgi:cytochrome c553
LRLAVKSYLARRARFIIVTLVVTGIALVAAGFIFVWLGIYDISASVGHSPPVAWFLHFAMRRSVIAHAAELPTPDLTDPKLILRGALHYSSGCAPCHGAPGQLASPITQQMTPVPPGLYVASSDFDPSQLFWIIKNGVKMTAMPAWPAPQREDEIWDLVAFMEQLPKLKTPDYLELIGNPSQAWLPQLPTATFDPSSCSRCHGDDGRGRSGLFPSIAGKPAADIEASLRAYRDGTRSSGFMQPVAAALTEAQLIAAARYYASLSVEPAR